jgi:hypothetical protein
MVSTYINVVQATTKRGNGDLFQTYLISTVFEPSRQTSSALSPSVLFFCTFP